MTVLNKLVSFLMIISTLLLIAYSALLVTDIWELSSKVGSKLPYIYIQRSTVFFVACAFFIALASSYFSGNSRKNIVIGVNVFLIFGWIISIFTDFIGVSPFS
ncbi:hypothetical protein [Catenovulum sediminis]|uniref:Uncharacterized protein n=1 Tax=Catenovulum sediminis TaxID=1740262 RepID=A0ABV1RDN6_9ALTE